MEDQFAGSCWKCANEGVEMVTSALGHHQSVADVILSTTPFIPNHKIKKSLGIVSGEAIIGANVFSDMLASVTDIVGGRSGSYENRLKYAREVAITQMALEAKAEGGNAIVGISLSYESVRGTMLMVAAYGTAVVSIPEVNSSK
ncbi:MAG TPA: YbjQ family protein [Nitrososphaera sp.]|nr:YbjQ family protein [Nitrososphaera sp.]